MGGGIYVESVLILLIPSSQASLSSVKSNEQMLLSCWSQHDGLSRWQAHPSAERKWEGSSGRRTACQGALTLLCFSPSSFLIAAFISDIQASFHPGPRPQHSATHCPVHLSPCQPFCSTDHLPVVCPCSQVKAAACQKGQNIYNKVSKASERPKREKRGGTAVGGMWLNEGYMKSHSISLWCWNHTLEANGFNGEAREISHTVYF